MIANLSPELVRELEQAGDQPLPVVNPQTKRVYVLVDAEQFDVIRRAPSTPESWTEEKNERRCALIRKKFTEGISDAESHELASLQDELSSYRQRVAPMPYDIVDALRAAVDSTAP